MKRALPSFLVALILALCTVYATSVNAGQDPRIPCTRAIPACLAKFRLDRSGNVAYFRSFPLEKPQSNLRQAIIVIHGTLRNADQYFELMNRAAQLARRDRDTVVIAPWIKAGADRVMSDELLWDRSGWKQGDQSISKGLPSRSSFSVMDALIKQLSNRELFPALERIVVTGHSAGGQVVQRYAAGTPHGKSIGAPELVFIVSNPSSYLYLNEFRLNPATNRFEVPDRAQCADYNHYRYGLERLNPYMSFFTPRQIAEQYVRRNVVYLLGSADNDPNASDLDISCPAVFQGPGRFDRGVAYFAHLKQFFPGNRHIFQTVGGTGHDAAQVYQSPVGLRALFGRY